MAQTAPNVTAAGQPLDPRIEELVAVVMKLTAGELGTRAEISPSFDSVDAIAVGLNWLGEELEARQEELENLVAERTARLERTLAELQQSRQQFANLLESLPVGVFVVNADGTPRYANRVATELLGRGALPGVALDGLAEAYGAVVAGTDDAYPTDRMPLAKALKGEPSSVDDMEILRDHARIPLEVVGTPILNNEGGIDTAIAVFHDITERRQIEIERQKHAEELARSNAELEQFAYVASHDLQEPLRMITSYCQLLQQRYQGTLDADADEFIHFAVDGATRMQALIQGLLTYARVGSRAQPLQPTETSVALRQALSNLELLVAETGTRIESAGLPRVLGDGGQLVQLFQNLIANAIKFRNGHPPLIGISARRLPDRQWQFAVSDNGIGFAPEFSERVFAIFQRLHTSAEYPGTGIGLAVCKKIVDRHGGRIWVESEPGKGSTFKFTLQAAEVDEHGD